MSKNIKLITFSLLFILSSILLSIRELHTESPQNKMLLGSNYKETVKDNIILLVDNSGSMKTTDPSRLATVAASMLVDTLGPESSMNIIAFGDKIQTFSRLKDKPTPQALKNFMSGLDYGDNHTNLKDGLSEALDQLDEVEGTKRIIILSDGKEDPKGGLTKDHEDELNSLIERAYNSKVEIHTIGLSSLADEEMLNRISYRTGGNIFFSSNPAELFDIFNRIIGEAQGYYTLDRYSVASPGNREINFSSFVEEVVIKVASIDNKMPNVEVSENGKEISAEKYSDRYKIFGIKNSGDSSLKIQTLDNGKNLIIIQMKSRVGLKINTQDGSFQLPHRIPMDISCSLDVEDEIQGLHMDKVIDGKREPLVKQDDKFIFRFQENDQGLYPIFITAYDGNNNIIAVKSVDINITDSPPFYYTDELPQEFIIGSSFTINLKQMDNTPVDSVSGEVIIDYGDIRDTFPLSIKDSTLSADISFRKAGEIRFGACINGIYNNSSFSYYLPENKMELLEQPHINIETLDNREALKKSEVATLRLKIIDNLTYGDEDITVYDDAGNNIGKFTVKKNQKGNIDVAITPLEKTSDLILKLNGSKELKLTEKIDTKKRVLDGAQYLFNRFKMSIILLTTIAVSVTAIFFLGWLNYRSKVQNYKVVKDLYYRVNGKIRTLSIELSVKNCPTIFINLGEDSIYESVKEERAIGCFELRWPKGTKAVTGLLYIFKGKSIFEVSYDAIIDQTIFLDEMEENTPVSYRDDLLIRFKHRSINYEIQFQ